ncbi:hypothetical protein [Umezawaea sp. Da 62-37]|uniref:hypothetical protein n=1 Tax=Umezawaea sp. Da 62-37 TaxID=3075927 RepID=UPI0028F6CE2E|nr:hypothetical protein [Umezawaea sp. Da 62-37]WNV84692.1 hypothetical protein RM788_42085 [Umezawaea sp. Da 62-37]
MTDQPGYTPDQITRGLSLPRRIGYVLVGLAGLTAASVIGQLWATEPTALPARTQLAFAAMITIGLTWAGFGAYTVIRRPLFAVDRIIAAALALTFSTLMTAGTVVLALTRDSTAGVLTASAIGLVLIVAACTMLLRARTYRAALLARRRDLEGRDRTS